MDDRVHEDRRDRALAVGDEADSLDPDLGAIVEEGRDAVCIGLQSRPRIRRRNESARGESFPERQLHRVIVRPAFVRIQLEDAVVLGKRSKEQSGGDGRLRHHRPGIGDDSEERIRYLPQQRVRSEREVLIGDLIHVEIGNRRESLKQKVPAPRPGIRHGQHRVRTNLLLDGAVPLLHARERITGRLRDDELPVKETRIDIPPQRLIDAKRQRVGHAGQNRIRAAALQLKRIGHRSLGRVDRREIRAVLAEADWRVRDAVSAAEHGTVGDPIGDAESRREGIPVEVVFVLRRPLSAVDERHIPHDCLALSGDRVNERPERARLGRQEHRVVSVDLVEVARLIPPQSQRQCEPLSSLVRVVHEEPERCQVDPRPADVVRRGAQRQTEQRGRDAATAHTGRLRRRDWIERQRHRTVGRIADPLNGPDHAAHLDQMTADDLRHVRRCRGDVLVPVQLRADAIAPADRRDARTPIERQLRPIRGVGKLRWNAGPVGAE